MPTQLTTPVAKNTTQATVDSWHLEVVRDPITLLPLTDQTQLTVTVSLRFADGTVSNKQVVGVALNTLPAGALNTVRTFHQAIIAFMRAQGVLPAGVDTADL